jgi:hypothetical protein
MFGRGDKETKKLLREILAELRKMNKVWQPETKPIRTSPSFNPEPDSPEGTPILERPLARSKGVLFGESLVHQVTAHGNSLDSLVPVYRSFTRHEIEEALALLIEDGKIYTKSALSTVGGVQARRVIYKAVVR